MDRYDSFAQDAIGVIETRRPYPGIVIHRILSQDGFIAEVSHTEFYGFWETHVEHPPMGFTMKEIPQEYYDTALSLAMDAGK